MDGYSGIDVAGWKEEMVICFGDLEELARDRPETYAHKVLCHGFMEYDWANRITERLQNSIAIGAARPYDPVEHTMKKDELLKEVYYDWARRNGMDELLLDWGWNEYMND